MSCLREAISTGRHRMVSHDKNSPCCRGKYTVVFPDNGDPAFPLRYGKLWPAYEGKQIDNLTVALAQDLIDTRAENERIRKALRLIKTILDEADDFPAQAAMVCSGIAHTTLSPAPSED